VREICLLRLDKTGGTGLDPRGGAGRDDQGDRRSHHHQQGLVQRGPGRTRQRAGSRLCGRLDNVLSVAVNLLGRTVGYLTAEQEAQLARAVILAYDLDITLLEGPAGALTAA